MNLLARRFRLLAVLSLIAAAATLAACTGPVPNFNIPFTGVVLPSPDFPNAGFQTVAEVTLRSGQDDESSPVALLPLGTPVVPIGIVGAECECWKVATPAGSGWLYTRYIASRVSDLD